MKGDREERTIGPSKNAQLSVALFQKTKKVTFTRLNIFGDNARIWEFISMCVQMERKATVHTNLTGQYRLTLF